MTCLELKNYYALAKPQKRRQSRASAEKAWPQVHALKNSQTTTYRHLMIFWVVTNILDVNEKFSML